MAIIMAATNKYSKFDIFWMIATLPLIPVGFAVSKLFVCLEKKMDKAM